MSLKFQSILKKIITLVLVSICSQVSAATIEIKDSTDLVQNYAFLGAAYLCGDSKKLSTIERLEMQQIEDHYKKIVKSQIGKIIIDWRVARGAADEVFGLNRNTISYSACSKILKK